MGESVVTALREGGAEPILLPPEPADVNALVAWILEHARAVVLTGGAFDIHPTVYGQQVQARLDRVDRGRTDLELALARACIERGVPVLGVCGGMQVLAVAAGGTLIQDILSQVPGAEDHEQPEDPATPSHAVDLEPGPLREAFGQARIEVKSTHHQAVESSGSLVISGRAPDGVVEVVHHPSHPFCVGVQWHPELLDPAPYRALVTSII